MSPVIIRPAREADSADIAQAIVELQEFERRLHDSRLPGEAIAAPYFAWLQRQIAEKSGAMLVAESAGGFVGFLACWIERDDYIPLTPAAQVFGYVADVCILPPWRGQDIAGRLLAAAERHLADAGARHVLVGALAANDSALAAYRKRGFTPYTVMLEKRLNHP
jgi:ribosomal protein S18 acetylase RimI-like enzyme